MGDVNGGGVGDVQTTKEKNPGGRKRECLSVLVPESHVNPLQVSDLPLSKLKLNAMALHQ